MDYVQLTQALNNQKNPLSADQQHDIEVAYDYLKRIARSQRFKVKGTGLNTTALVNEAWIKSQKAKSFNDRNHFFAYCALAMRHILLNEAKKHRLLTYVDSEADFEQPLIKESDSLLDLERHLEKLKAFNPRLEQIFTYKFFGDMEFDAIAVVLDVSERTVFRDWKKAKAMFSMKTALTNKLI